MRSCTALGAEAPPLARIEHVERIAVQPLGIDGFTIRQSADAPDRRQPVPPDAALCAACEAELFDPANRRYRYPFITCTDCGPRYTVIEAMPYDRERTSMRAFTQCEACQREYRTARGSALSLGDEQLPRVRAPGVARGRRAPRACARGQCPGSGRLRGHQGAAELLAAGYIVAIRGLGGFHLAVDATNEQAVQRLRARKQRDAKPLAVMVRTARRGARAGARRAGGSRRCSTSRERPIVLLDD